MKIGFVGLGLMGLPMARNLLRAGHELVVASASAAARDSLRREGAQVMAEAGEVAAFVEIFCSCRVTPQHSRDTFLGADGVEGHGRAGLLCIDFATIDPGTARDIAAALARRGIGFLDAPVSGGPPAAAAGSLTVIVGGPEADVARARPLFERIGKAVHHMGPVGTGLAAKLCNNMITITTHALLAEAMVMGAKAGIDARRLYEVLRASSARSESLERALPRHFLPRNFAPAATITNIMKDLECAIGMARRFGASASLAETAMQRYVEAVGAGHAEKDIAAVILPLEEAAGVRIGPA
jgi:3-hydroxyisobutyrate dehydrogenase